MLAALFLFVACTDKQTPAGDDTSPTETGDTGDTGTIGDDNAAWCADNGFGASVPFDSKGPYGTYRHDLAEDFTVPLMDGTEWHFAEEWRGCESYIFIPDALTRDESDDRPVYTKDVDTLIAESPRNAHYFFMSVQRDSATADENQADAQDKVDSALADLSKEDADWWRSHLHVVSGRAQDLGGWVESVGVRGIGSAGFAVDPWQKIRGIGALSDVSRYDSSLSWPFKNNLAYAAHEARYFNMEVARQATLDAEDATVVPLWTGEVISEYQDMAIDLPSAEVMATFDTMEIDVDMRCPDAESPEFANCGAWDYIAGFYVQAPDESWTELGRFITTYHRESHWVLDATPMMAHLLDGGNRTFRWSWAPYWNVQPTETRVSLRFSNQGKGYAPRSATLVAVGGSFGSTYNDAREPVALPLAADDKKVQLWAVISGHGAGTNQCAEFCNHQHEFTVNGNVHLQQYPGAQTEDGCVDDIEGQMTPNQWGTWWYGRGGWCPGGIVHPYDVDLTSEVSPGTDATIGYRGLFGGATPPDGAGDIVMNAWVIEYR